MKVPVFIIFILTALTVFALANYYVGLRGYQALPPIKWFRIVYLTVFITLAISFFVAKVLEKSQMLTVLEASYYLGSYWLAALLYLFMAVVFIDLIRVSDSLLHFLPDRNTLAYQNIKIYTLTVTLIVLASILIHGRWNALHACIKNVDINIHKNAGVTKELNVVMVSDIHLGSLFGKAKVEKMAQRINNLKPDIIFLCGDILDEVQAPIFHHDIGSPLKLLKAPLGVFGITGNHEYIGGVKDAVKYLESQNIKMLRDTCILINNSFYLAGRDDKDGNRFEGKGRKMLSEILQGVDHQLPILLLDHQPYKLSQAVENGVDLQLSGHTHNGQFWPFNLITSRVWELNWGYKLKGNTHFYVSCGYGTWGPPVRNFSKPEIINIKLKFNNKP